jgi:hypothetical protein
MTEAVAGRHTPGNRICVSHAAAAISADTDSPHGLTKALELIAIVIYAASAVPEGCQMKWRKLGRVFVADKHSPWLHSHATLPIGRPLGEYRYRIYFNPRDTRGRSNVSWLDIDIRDPTKILRISERPLIEYGAPGCFDDNGAMASWIVEHDGQELLYYQGWNLGVTVPFRAAIGLAVRPVGEPDHSFERISVGPILDRCIEEPVSVGAPAVLEEAGKWRMWYQSGYPWRSGPDRPLPLYDIRYAESNDGIRWVLSGQQAITFEHAGEVAMTRFCPLREADGRYSAWYAYRGDEWGYYIGYAASPDGIGWARSDGIVGIACDQDSWEAPMISYPFVFDTEQGRFMLYNAGRYGTAGFGIAVLDQD